MVMTEGALLFLGALATLATIGMFIDFGDEPTRIVIGFVAALLWGIFGMSSFDVIVVDSYAAVKSEPITPLAYLGIGFAMVLTGFWFYKLVRILTGGGEATDDVSPIE